MENQVIQRVQYLALSIFLASTSNAVLAQTVDGIFKGMIDAENAGYESIDDYVLKTNTLGITTFEYYEKAPSIELDNGQTVYVMRSVPADEIQERYSGSNELSAASAEELREAARMIERAGADMESGMANEMEGSGLPGGVGNMLMNPPTDEAWLSSNPRNMTSMYATMLNASADAKDARAAENMPSNAQRQAESMAAIQSQTEITGRREFNGVDAIELSADNLNYTQTEGDAEVTWNSVQMLVDAERYVPLLFVMDGLITEGGESRQMTIEREDLDYRNVAGCGDMYRPFKSIMRMNGVMTPEEQAQMAEASEQMAELEAQMASMPASQRKMMESMMGPQLEMFKNMASGGGFELETSIAELRCNTGLPNPVEIANTTFGGNFAGVNVTAPSAVPDRGSVDRGAVNTEEGLLRMIQLDLERLGFRPGNTDGVLDKPTVVAISKFQASKGREVTGQPSPQLAGILQATPSN